MSCCVCDEVLADAHFPTSSVCRCGPREIRADGLYVVNNKDVFVECYNFLFYCSTAVIMVNDTHTRRRRLL